MRDSQCVPGFLRYGLGRSASGLAQFRMRTCMGPGRSLLIPLGDFAEGGIVDIAFTAVTVKRRRSRRVQGSIQSKAGGQIRVCDKRLAESDRVGPACIESCLSRLRREALIGDIGTLEKGFEQRADTVRRHSLPRADKCNAPATEFARDMAKGRHAIRVAH